MKKLFTKFVTFSLVAALLIACSPTALAAPSRNKGNVKYLSEVALIEAVSDDEAQKALTELKKEENGGFTDMITLDLNKGGQKKVYLVYKTSTNVDDAITDLAVMNMEGDYSMGNYEQLLTDTINGYMEVTEDYRVMAAAFAANYAAGNDNAELAYRQMNYYYIEENGVKTYMGDYMLNFPASNDSFANILFKGNLNIIGNLRTLLAMGIGGSENTLAMRIAEAYQNAEADGQVYQNASYEKTAKVLQKDLEGMKKDLLNLEAEMSKVKEEELDQEEKELLLETMQRTLDVSQAFLDFLKEIPMGDTTLGDYVMNTAVIEVNNLYPVVAAGSQAEQLLMEYHSLYSLLLYSGLRENMADLEAALAELEEGFQPLSVFHGVQNDLIAGTIGVTGDAEISSNSSGKSFWGIFSDPSTMGASIGLSVLGVGGVASMIGGVAYLVKTAAANTAANASQKLMWQQAVEKATAEVEKYNQLLGNSGGKIRSGHMMSEQFLEYNGKLATAETELNKCTAKLNSVSNSALTGGQIFVGSLFIAVGAVSMGISIWQLTKLYNKYEIAYTDIPDNMVDVVSYEDGDRFVNYKNVPAYYYEADKLLTRENDLNAYGGRQWVSLYYTKNYEAGYCLTSSPDLIATEAEKTGYTSVHLFGRSDGYNTNAYCNRENADAVYLAFKYSTNQKSAVTDVPDIVGSLFNAGTIAISALVGFAAGIVLMASVNKRKMKEDKAKK